MRRANSGYKAVKSSWFGDGCDESVGVVDLIDKRIGEHEHNNVSAGEAVAAMVVNGLECVNQPLSLTPQFFETKALDVLFGTDI